jgi:hypothetical protein
MASEDFPALGGGASVPPPGASDVPERSPLNASSLLSLVEWGCDKASADGNVEEDCTEVSWKALRCFTTGLVQVFSVAQRLKMGVRSTASRHRPRIIFVSNAFPPLPSAGAIGNSTQQPESDRRRSLVSYGLLGSGVIRMTDADRNALALGSVDLMLGLNYATEQIYSTFSSHGTKTLA